MTASPLSVARARVGAAEGDLRQLVRSMVRVDPLRHPGKYTRMTYLLARRQEQVAKAKAQLAAISSDTTTEPTKEN